MKARHLKAILLRKVNKIIEAENWVKETLAIDQFDFGSRNEFIEILSYIDKDKEAEMQREALQTLVRDWDHSYIEIAIDYARAGCYKEAIDWLLQIDKSAYPMLHYYLAYYYSKIDNLEEKNKALQKGFHLSPDRVFPNRLEDILVLQFIIKENTKDYKAPYYLGNLWYDKRQYTDARQCWEQSLAQCDNFPTAHRNLGIAYYNKFNKTDCALNEYKKSFSNDPSDTRVLFELDQLYKNTNKPVRERLTFLEKYFSQVKERDDLYIEYITLHNLSGNYQEALQLLENRNFHPWEGGEGKVAKQYVYTKVALAKKAFSEENYECAIQLLEEAQHYPENLGEGKLYGAQENNIFYWLGCAYKAVGNGPLAVSRWQKAAEGLSEPVQAIYYNDQDPAMIFYQGLALQKLDKNKEAEKRFKDLISYGEKHLNDKIEIDFFAVSLPDLSVFEIDPDKQNHIHCLYLMGLGYVGLGEVKQADGYFKEVLKIDISHRGAIEHSNFLRENGRIE